MEFTLKDFLHSYQLGTLQEIPEPQSANTQRSVSHRKYVRAVFNVPLGWLQEEKNQEISADQFIAKLTAFGLGPISLRATHHLSNGMMPVELQFCENTPLNPYIKIFMRNLRNLDAAHQIASDVRRTLYGEGDADLRTMQKRAAVQEALMENAFPDGIRSAVDEELKRRAASASGERTPG